MSLLEVGREVLRVEARTLDQLCDRLGPEFDAAIERLAACTGKVVFTGMGKSGIVCRKIAATFSSTGTPAFFLHPAEGVHGDLGILSRGDVVVAVSNSGETEELVEILPVVRRLELVCIAITGNRNSTLARRSEVLLHVPVEREACPLNLAPMASTTATLALGDALAAALMHRKGFTADDFARFHPAGILGRQLTLQVGDLMHEGDAVPRVGVDAPMRETLLTMTSKRLGLAGAFDAAGKLAGVVTDGDLRRALERGGDLLGASTGEVMTRDPKTVPATMLAVEALRLMEEFAITCLFVVDQEGSRQACGVIHIHDLVKAGLR